MTDDSPSTGSGLEVGGALRFRLEAEGRCGDGKKRRRGEKDWNIVRFNNGLIKFTTNMKL
jgi:hypothetical protein